MAARTQLLMLIRGSVGCYGIGRDGHGESFIKESTTRLNQRV